MRKVCLIVAITCLLIVGICGCSVNDVIKDNVTNLNNEEVSINEILENNNINYVENILSGNKKVAVVYFSATGNTKTVAEYIKEETRADIFEIIPKQIYTADDIDYGKESRSKIEQNDKNTRPEIANDINVSNYDVIFLGYPIWYGDVPRIIQTFIETEKLNNKIVILFCTSGSSGITGSENTLKQYDNIIWVAGQRFSGNSSKAEVKNWLDSLEIFKHIGDERMTREIKLKVNDKELVVELEDNVASKALFEKIKESDVIVNAHDYGDFEKVGDLNFSLPSEDEQVTTEVGDIVLYQGNQISLFYDSNSWSYTKLGKIKNISKEELKDILGNGDVVLSFSLK